MEEVITIVHVDDDPGALRRLKSLLNELPGVAYLGGFTGTEEALAFLAGNDTDLILLDVEMPGNNGLWLAEQLRSRQPEIAFITAHAGYAARAFDVCALDYLLKPMSKDKLQVLLERVRYKRANGIKNMQEQVEAIYRYLDPNQRPTRIFISAIGKTYVIKLDEVLYFNASINYTNIVMKNGEQHTSSKTIRTYLEALKHYPDFVRVSRSAIVNRCFIEVIERDDKARRYRLRMTNGDFVNTTFVSRDELLEQLNY